MQPRLHWLLFCAQFVLHWYSTKAGLCEVGSEFKKKGKTVDCSTSKCPKSYDCKDVTLGPHDNQAVCCKKTCTINGNVLLIGKRTNGRTECEKKCKCTAKGLKCAGLKSKKCSKCEIDGELHYVVNLQYKNKTHTCECDKVTKSATCKVNVWPKWTEWGHWSVCSSDPEECGKTVRHRMCVDNRGLLKGDDRCLGDNHQSTDCCTPDVDMIAKDGWQMKNNTINNRRKKRSDPRTTVKEREYFSWMVSLSIPQFNVDKDGNPSNHVCGGSILNKHWIMTAAHCVCYQSCCDHNNKMSCDIKDWKVNTGILILDKLKGKLTHKIAEVIIHPSYKKDPNDRLNDVALIRVDTEFNFDDPNVQPCAIPTSICTGESLDNCIPHEELAERQDCEFVGWGNDYGVSNSLKWIKIFVNTDQLSLAWEKKKIGVTNLKRGSQCRGDSGGPLMCKPGDSSRLGKQWNERVVLGIASYTDPVGHCLTTKETTTYFGLVPYFLEWMADAIPDWSPWGRWSPCTTHCGGDCNAECAIGAKTRSRSCFFPEYGYIRNAEPLYQTAKECFEPRTEKCAPKEECDGDTTTIRYAMLGERTVIPCRVPHDLRWEDGEQSVWIYELITDKYTATTIYSEHTTTDSWGPGGRWKFISPDKYERLEPDSDVNFDIVIRNVSSSDLGFYMCNINVGKEDVYKHMILKQGNASTENCKCDAPKQLSRDDGKTLFKKGYPCGSTVMWRCNVDGRNMTIEPTDHQTCVDGDWYPDFKGGPFCVVPTNDEGHSVDSSPCKEFIKRGLCKNGGWCTVHGETSDAYCSCRPYFSGVFCEVKTDEFCGIPCHHGNCSFHEGSLHEGIIDEGTADEVPYSYNSHYFECKCHKGWAGRGCNHEIGSPCIAANKEDMCKGGSWCKELEVDYRDIYDSPHAKAQPECQCRPYTTGVSCNETSEHYCSMPHYCVNGDCLFHDEKEHYFTCQCHTGWFGSKCDISEKEKCDSRFRFYWNEWQESHCLNGGVCFLDKVVDESLGWYELKCRCSQWTTGSRCETWLSP